MAQMDQSKTRVEYVYQALRDEIFAGRLQPGQRVNLGDLAKAHEVSLTVVREAVTRLASDRLMEATPQRGFRVWPLSIDDLLDITRVRIEIESLAVRESVTSGDLAWEADLVAAHHRLAGVSGTSGVASSATRSAWMSAHSGFHAAVAAACSSPLLKDMRQQLFDSSELYRQWTAQSSRVAGPKKKRLVAKEHRQILDAALARNADAAVDLTVEHIQRTTDILLAGAELAGSQAN